MTIAVLLAVVLVLAMLIWLGKRLSQVRILRRVTTIEVGVTRKLSKEYRAQYGELRGTLLAVAVVDRLFATQGQHEPEILKLAERLAREVVQTDEEVRYAALMSLRALFCVYTGSWHLDVIPRPKDTITLIKQGRRREREGMRRAREAARRAWETQEWMKQFWELPLEWPSQQMIEWLAADFAAKYP
jgi:hypothetical protein